MVSSPERLALYEVAQSWAMSYCFNDAERRCEVDGSINAEVPGGGRLWGLASRLGGSVLEP